MVNYFKSLGHNASKYTRDKMVTVMSSEKEKMDKVRTIILLKHVKIKRRKVRRKDGVNPEEANGSTFYFSWKN